MTCARNIDTPIEINMKLQSDERGAISNKKCYQHFIGNLIYLIATRLDIMYLVNTLSQFMQNPTKLHVTVYKILR